jgi:methylglutaconyl-CoA hydratase
MTEPLVKSETRGLAQLLTLNRPEVKNALSFELVSALLEQLAAAERSPRVRAVVLTGAGSDFCAGADLKALRELSSRSREENLVDSRHLAELFRRLRSSSKPVVAAVVGHALAGGCGLAAVCDRVVASADSKFGFTEARIGFVPAIVATFLVGRCGERVARDLLLTGRRVEASEALALGLADQVAPAAEVVERAVAWADALKPCAPSSLATTKKLLADLPGLSLDPALELAAQTNADARSSDECREGVAAFLEKRKPRWLAEP